MSKLKEELEKPMKEELAELIDLLIATIEDVIRVLDHPEIKSGHELIVARKDALISTMEVIISKSKLELINTMQQAAEEVSK
jgi:hypothetical protein